MTEAEAGSAAVGTFLIADVRGYTRFTQREGDEAAALLAGRFAQVVREQVEARGGRVVELRGDEALCVFESPRNALRAAVELQRRCADEIRADPSLPLRIGIGIDAGEAVPVEGGYRGGALNLAARLCSLAKAGEVLTSEGVAHLARRVEGIVYADRGMVAMKGLEQAVRVLQVQFELSLPEERVATRRRPGVLALSGVGIGAIVVAALVAALIASRGAPSARAAGFDANVVGVMDGSGRVVGQVPLAGRPAGVAAAGGWVWVIGAADGTVSQVAADSKRVVHAIDLGTPVSDVAADSRGAWVLEPDRRALVRIAAAYGQATGRAVSLPAPVAADQFGTLSLAEGAGALWATDGSTALLKFDPESGVLLKTFDLRRPLNDIAVGGSSVWVSSQGSASVLEVNASTGRVRARVPIVGRPGIAKPIPIALAVGDGAVWVLNGNTPSITEIDPGLGSVRMTVPLGVGSNPTSIAVGMGGVWISESARGSLARLDTLTHSVEYMVVGGSPRGVAVDGSQLWVSVQPGFAAGASARAPSSTIPGSLPSTFCGPVEYGGSKSRPQVLIASDLPLQVPDVLGLSLQVSDAIRFELARRGFTAGKYAVGYQSCDDSAVQFASWSNQTCIRNAKAYARSQVLLAVVGPFNSGCAFDEIPVLNRAQPAPLALISPSATVAELTRAGPANEPGLPNDLYPTGTRNFARVIATDDAQGAADAMLARRLGAHRVYVLDDSEFYGQGLAASFSAAAHKLGITIAGSGSWSVNTRTFTSLARRAARTKPDAVLLGGAIQTNGVGMLQALRTQLGQNIPIIAPDGFSDTTALGEQAGPAAEGLLISVPATAVDRLPPAGRTFTHAFGEAIGGQVYTFSATAAQAVDVILGAIAKSDGTRASVTANLMNAHVSNGILGTFHFDSNGDTTAGAVSIYRVKGGRLVTSAVITPPLELLP